MIGNWSLRFSEKPQLDIRNEVHDDYNQLPGNLGKKFSKEKMKGFVGLIWAWLGHAFNFISLAWNGLSLILAWFNWHAACLKILFGKLGLIKLKPSIPSQANYAQACQDSLCHKNQAFKRDETPPMIHPYPFFIPLEGMGWGVWRCLS